MSRKIFFFIYSNYSWHSFGVPDLAFTSPTDRYLFLQNNWFTSLFFLWPVGENHWSCTLEFNVGVQNEHQSKIKETYINYKTWTLLKHYIVQGCRECNEIVPPAQFWQGVKIPFTTSKHGWTHPFQSQKVGNPEHDNTIYWAFPVLFMPPLVALIIFQGHISVR